MSDKGAMSSPEVVTFDVSGRTFSISLSVLENAPCSRLKHLTTPPTSTLGHNDVIRVDRPADIFGAILAFCQTGDLHIPSTSCPSSFLNEMKYWEIPIECLSECCHIRLQCFLEEQRTLAKFKSHLTEQDDLTQSKFSLSVFSCLNTARAALWLILDCRSKSFLARLYFVVSVVMVFLSIFALAYGTDRHFRRSMTNCERLEYMISADMEDVDIVRGLFASTCNDAEPPGFGGAPQPVQLNVRFLPRPPNNNNNNNNNNVPGGDFIDIFVPDPPPTTPSTTKGSLQPSQLTSPDENFTSVNGDSNLFLGSSQGGKIVRVPNMQVKIMTLVIMDTITSIFFTADLIMRLFCCPCLLRYFYSLINIADAAALVATYFHMILVGVHRHYRYEDEWFDILEYMQMLRSLRFFRIVSNVPAGRVLAYTVFSNIKDLLILIMFLVSAMCVFASVFYIAETKAMVENIPNCWYWAVITMTTVGYGDIIPTTEIGRLIACTCAVCGVLLFAMTVPILANHFLTLYNYLMAQDSLDKMTARYNNRASFASPSHAAIGTQRGLEQTGTTMITFTNQSGMINRQATTNTSGIVSNNVPGIMTPNASPPLTVSSNGPRMT